MIYKVNINLCDFRVGSYVTLGTRAAQCYIYVIKMIQTKYFVFGLLVHQKMVFLKKSSFWLAGPFVNLEILFEQT